MKEFRSLCPIARSLDIFGDKWTLLILRDIASFGKTTYKELSQMSENIATNTLADRLDKLVKEGMLTKNRSDKNKLVFHYHITQKGLDLIPVIQEIYNWSKKYLYKEDEMKDLSELMTKVQLN